MHIQRSKVLLDFAFDHRQQQTHNSAYFRLTGRSFTHKNSSNSLTNPKHPHPDNKFAVREVDREFGSSNRQEIGMILRRWWRRKGDVMIIALQPLCNSFRLHIFNVHWLPANQCLCIACGGVGFCSYVCRRKGRKVLVSNTNNAACHRHKLAVCTCR